MNRKNILLIPLAFVIFLSVLALNGILNKNNLADTFERPTNNSITTVPSAGTIQIPKLENGVLNGSITIPSKYLDIVSYTPAADSAYAPIIGNYTIGGYHFYLTPKCEQPFGVPCQAWTDENFSVYIGTSISPYYIYKVCVHEVLHNIIKTQGAEEEAYIRYVVNRPYVTPYETTCFRLMDTIGAAK